MLIISFTRREKEVLICFCCTKIASYCLIDSLLQAVQDVVDDLIVRFSDVEVANLVEVLIYRILMLDLNAGALLL